MQDTDRFKLLFGPYETPLFEYGQIVFCECRGEVEIGLTDAKIPWPVAKWGRRSSLILYDCLADAVRRESNQAVGHWWGINGQTVTKWRKVLGVGPMTDGTSRLLSEYAREEPIAEGLKKAQAKARDPERRRKIAEAKRGKKRPRHVMAALRAANVGRIISDEQRAKMRAAHKRRGTIPPKAVGTLWTLEEDELVRALPATEAAERTGRSLKAVYLRRFRLGLPDGRTQDSRGSAK